MGKLRETNKARNLCVGLRVHQGCYQKAARRKAAFSKGEVIKNHEFTFVLSSFRNNCIVSTTCVYNYCSCSSCDLELHRSVFFEKVIA